MAKLSWALVGGRVGTGRHAPKMGIILEGKQLASSASAVHPALGLRFRA